MDDNKLRAGLMYITRAGFQVNSDVLPILQELSSRENFEEIIKNVLREVSSLEKRPLFLPKEVLQKYLRDIRRKEGVTPKLVREVTAKEISAEIEVKKDPSALIGGINGEIGDFLAYFRSRLEKLRQILRQRADLVSFSYIKDCKKTNASNELTIIGIIAEKKEVSKGVLIKVEDETGSVKVFVSNSDSRLLAKAQKLMLDQVVGFHIRKWKSIFVATDIIWPDVPERRVEKRGPDILAALISDLHIGSRYFLEKVFRKFLRWLRGDGIYAHQDLARKVKYLIIAGDVVDGIGVYPEQEKELKIGDIYEQYNIAAKYLAEIPDYVEIIVVPGNHDAVRQALPQPAILRKYAEPIYSLDRVWMLGNPALISIHGIDILVYHGRSFEDVIRNVPNTSPSKPQKIMSALLKARHLAPVYGGKTPLAPERNDFLVIEDLPDVFHTGHIHVNGYGNYRGIVTVNSGTWQAQTEYQRKMGIVPTPGRLALLNLATLRVFEIKFLS